MRNYHSAEHTDHLTQAQFDAIRAIHERYGNPNWNPRDFWHTFDLPAGWVAGWVTRAEPPQDWNPKHEPWRNAIYIGVSPDGEISS